MSEGQFNSCCCADHICMIVQAAMPVIGFDPIGSLEATSPPDECPGMFNFNFNGTKFKSYLKQVIEYTWCDPDTGETLTATAVSEVSRVWKVGKYVSLTTSCDGLIYEDSMDESDASVTRYRNPAFFDVDGNCLGTSTKCATGCPVGVTFGTYLKFGQPATGICGTGGLTTYTAVSTNESDAVNRTQFKVGSTVYAERVTTLSIPYTFDDLFDDCKALLDTIDLDIAAGPDGLSIPVCNSTEFAITERSFWPCNDPSPPETCIASLQIEGSRAATNSTFGGIQGVRIQAYKPDGVTCTSLKHILQGCRPDGGFNTMQGLTPVAYTSVDALGSLCSWGRLLMQKSYSCDGVAVKKLALYPEDIGVDPVPPYDAFWTICGLVIFSHTADQPPAECAGDFPAGTINPPDELGLLFLPAFSDQPCASPC